MVILQPRRSRHIHSNSSPSMANCAVYGAASEMIVGLTLSGALMLATARQSETMKRRSVALELAVPGRGWTTRGVTVVGRSGDGSVVR